MYRVHVVSKIIPQHPMMYIYRYMYLRYIVFVYMIYFAFKTDTPATHAQSHSRVTHQHSVRVFTFIRCVTLNTTMQQKHGIIA